MLSKDFKLKTLIIFVEYTLIMIVEYKGCQIFYSDEGWGSPVVLLHGFLENSTMWDSLLPHLILSNRVICIDLLGHGQTGCIGYVHTMEAMADAVKAVIDVLKITTFKLIGHSMGGYVALALADKYPKLIDGLCLMNSTALEDNAERKINRDRAIEAVKKNHKTFIGLSITNLFAPDNRLSLAKAIELVKNEALKTPVQGIVAALEGMKIRPNREHILKSQTFKIMMIIGRKDPVLEYDTLIKQTQNTTVEVVEFPDGHMSHIENTYEFTYKILHFIEK
jgi:pimeloyl-ACP methyl ester carboxylesterase